MKIGGGGRQMPLLLPFAVALLSLVPPVRRVLLTETRHHIHLLKPLGDSDPGALCPRESERARRGGSQLLFKVLLASGNTVGGSPSFLPGRVYVQRGPMTT